MNTPLDFEIQTGFMPSPLTYHLVTDWLMERVFVAPNGCWLWTGADSGDSENGGRGRGYPKMKLPRSRKTIYVHRLVYQCLVGPIPKGHQIDHACKHWDKDAINYGNALVYRRCCNPAHLEAVTQSDNLKRNSFAGQSALNI